MKMHNPPHPGEVLRELCPEPLEVNVSEACPMWNSDGSQPRQAGCYY